MYPTKHLLMEIEWTSGTGWEPPKVVSDRMFTQDLSKLVDPSVDKWKDIVSSAIHWGRKGHAIVATIGRNEQRVP